MCIACWPTDKEISANMCATLSIFAHFAVLFLNYWKEFIEDLTPSQYSLTLYCLANMASLLFMCHVCSACSWFTREWLCHLFCCRRSTRWSVVRLSKNNFVNPLHSLWAQTTEVGCFRLKVGWGLVIGRRVEFAVQSLFSQLLCTLIDLNGLWLDELISHWYSHTWPL